MSLFFGYIFSTCDPWFFSVISSVLATRDFVKKFMIRASNTCPTVSKWNSSCLFTAMQTISLLSQGRQMAMSSFWRSSSTVYTSFSSLVKNLARRTFVTVTYIQDALDIILFIRHFRQRISIAKCTAIITTAHVSWT